MFLKWSQEINKSFGASKCKQYRGHKVFVMAGYISGKSVWFASIALKEPKQGDHCPYCGSKADPSETLSQVLSESGDTNDLDQLYYQGEFKCSNPICYKEWQLRSRIGKEGAVLDFYKERNPLVNVPPEIV